MRRSTRLVSLAAVAAVLLGVAPATAGARAAPAPAAVPTCAAPAEGRFTCLSLKRVSAADRTAPHGKPKGYGPAELRSAYRLPPSRSTETVAVVAAYDHPNAESDLAVYRRTFGLPPCTAASGCFRKVNQNGLPAPLPPPDPAWAGEISLDIDMVSAICPTCRILLVEADDASPNLLTAVRTAVALGARYVSMSWGAPEEPLEVELDPLVFDQPGVVFTAASGDLGHQGGVLYPAASPHVVAVGGTSLLPARNHRGWTESAWAGSGSGCSAYLPKPAFQHRISACSSRADSDVAAVADPDTGVAVYQTYGQDGWSVDGGTSAAAPIIAAVYALAGKVRHGDRPNEYPYARPGALFDVTTGTNGECANAVLCRAGRGWDGPTGLGTPNGTAAFTPPRRR
ncbi:Subtilase family protein [Lentzea fradiae]|uniref:Subtilase family protein n=1 Tax=Lentzea fradiae TaxID=200378 RepID=A0A1G8BE30_9PSEU|nr:S53 family peptidase [Lentzea fradiae]SDH31428.1 Subtilase family protein [Lentzea fradiae]